MLIGEKVCLGPVLQPDGPMFFGWMNSLDLVHDNGPYRPTDQASFDRWFGGIGQDPTRVVFAIRHRRDLRLMGYVQLINIMPAPRTAELGILIGAPSDRGQGYGQEAVRMAVQFGWRDLNLQRISLLVIGENPGAVRVYLKTGFEVEGVLRRASYVNGAFRDITIMGLLRLEADA